MMRPKLLLLLVLPIQVASLATPLSVSSQRESLLTKSQELQEQVNFDIGWSNRLGTAITPVAPDIYTADRPFIWNNIDVGGRATIIDLGGKSLWVHSPICLDEPTATSLAKLGTVDYICTPNYEHTKYASMWYNNDNQVNMWGCPGISEQVPDVPTWKEIPYGYRPPSWKHERADHNLEGCWDTSKLECLHIDVEHNPFTGKAFFNEVIFYHAPSKTLLTTDLFWNYPDGSGVPNFEFGRDDTWELAPQRDVPTGSLLWKFGMDKIYRPFYNTLMVKDKAEYQRIADHILNVWDVETVVPCHGDILRGKDFIRDVLSRFFDVKA